RVDVTRTGGLHPALPVVLIRLAQAPLDPERSLRAFRRSAWRRRSSSSREGAAACGRDRREGPDPQHIRHEQAGADVVRILRLATGRGVLPVPPVLLIGAAGLN